jgi:ABC-type branched-subunit amino acid transport system substrate-binding protein
MAVVLAFAIVAAACGDDEEPASQPAAPAEEPSAAPDPEPEAPAEEPEAPAEEAEAPAEEPEEPAEEPAEEPEEPAEEPEPEPEPVELTASYRGVTEDSIKIGVLLIDKDLLFETVGVLLNWGDNVAQYQEAIDAINEAGGVNGRSIEAVFELVDPLSETAYDEACVRLTQDEQVFAAVGFVRPSDAALCYAEVNDTPFVGYLSDINSGVTDRSVLPIITSNALPERMDVALATTVGATGALDGKTIAVLGNSEARNDLVVSALADMGYDVASTTVTAVPTDDEAADAAELDIVIQRWIADGVDFIFDTAGLDRPLAAANRAGFEADWASNRTTILSLSRFDSGATEAEVARTVVVAVPSVELIYEQGHGPTVACVDRWNQNHPDEQAVFYPGEDDLDNLQRIARSCQQIGTLARIAELAGPDLTTESFAAALAQVGSYEIAELPFASLGAGKWDANDVVTLFRWDSDLGDFVPGDFVDIG